MRMVPTALVLALAVPPGTPLAAQPVEPVSIGHEDVACVVADRHPRFEACVTPAASVGRAQVHFRANSDGPWYAVDLKSEGRCHQGLLPRPLKTTQSIQYYVDVVDRGFAESRMPDRAPDVAYTARVVGSEAECARLRMAKWATKSAQPVVVTVARDASGRALGSAALNVLEGNTILGFSGEGMVLAPAEAAGGGQASTGGSGTGAAAATGGIVGGIGVTTLAIAGGAVAVAGVVAVAAGGGDDGPDGPDGGGGDVNLTGTWSGPWTYTFSFSGAGTTTCTTEVTMQIQHSGGNFTANGTSNSTQCGGVTTGQGQGSIAGTASGGRISFTIPFAEAGCPPFQYVGTYSQNSMTGTVAASCAIQGGTFTWSGTWSATRR